MFKTLPIIIPLLTGCGATLSIENNTVVSKAGDKISSIQSTREISGIFPHLTTYSHARVNEKYKFGNECGIGAIAVWGNKLYMVNYAAHEPKGSEHSLYIIDADKKMTIYPGSVGGTPAARMIHKESNQLLMGHYLIDDKGNIRTIPITQMPGRITAIARHLEHPKEMVYYYDMEGMLYEANVNTLEVKKLYHNPLPGWHGKGGYTSQGRLVLANNGEVQGALEPTKDWVVPIEGMTGPEKYGILAEFDGKSFKVIERKQFTDVTTRHGIEAVPDDQSPLWSMGWDKRAVILNVMENGNWKSFLLPKATLNNDPSHGWFTEWPRIREVGNGELMMDMHGMFYDFPADFSQSKTAGIRPISSHLRYIPDFCSWNNQIVLATDESSIQGNPLTGQPQSNLWFGTKNELKEWGPSSGYGAIWVKDSVKANSPSLPYLFAGFDQRMLHLVNHTSKATTVSLEIDNKGDNNWTALQSIELPANGYQTVIFTPEIKGEWVRLSSNNEAVLTASFHYTQKGKSNSPEYAQLFDGLAEIDYTGKVIGGKLFSNNTNFNLSYFASTHQKGKNIDSTQMEFSKFNFKFKEGIVDSLAPRALETRVAYATTPQFNAKVQDKDKLNSLWHVDEASVIIETKNGRLRLPKGDSAFDNFTSGRSIRELESERELANIHGTMYELPLLHVGLEPRFTMMRPVASHRYQIDDFNTWNGLLVMTGIKADTKESNQIAVSEQGQGALWMGGIDDLWKLGKPKGKGGPWKNTMVDSGKLSDPYLMTGYDKKSVTLEADKATRITLWLTIHHYMNEPVAYASFDLEANKPFTYNFPEGFSAHWIQVSSDTPCKATAEFIYE